MTEVAARNEAERLVVLARQRVEGEIVANVVPHASLQHFGFERIAQVREREQRASSGYRRLEHALGKGVLGEAGELLAELDPSCRVGEHGSPTLTGGLVLTEVRVWGAMLLVSRVTASRPVKAAQARVQTMGAVHSCSCSPHWQCRKSVDR